MSYYVTLNRRPRIYQLTLSDLLDGIDESKLVVTKDTRDTMTIRVDRIGYSLRSKTDFWEMKVALAQFVKKYEGLIAVEDKSTFYRSFAIPKRSGGLRRIDAPNEDLKLALYELKEIFEKKLYASYHTSAFAYIRGRSTIDCVKRHQQNKSRWFLKSDMRHFFPSTSPDFMMKMLSMIFPFCELVKDEKCKTNLEQALSLCFLNGGLPQGTPTSPLLTNIMMIPIDHAISKMCHEHKPHLCYTRYADDILISSQYDFMWSEVQAGIVKILTDFGAPFELHPEKTRYGSSSGRNWNLGVMLNADNNITIGHAKKKVFKAMLFQFMADDLAGKTWNIEDTQHLLGLISYYKMVEGEAIDGIINGYSEKFGKDVITSIKAVLKPA